MTLSSKRNFTEQQQKVIWNAWSQGKSLSEIGRLIGKHAGSIFCFLQKYGGIRPTRCTRSKDTLSSVEREEISRGLSSALSVRMIARQLNRAPSTISRGINRNSGVKYYRAFQADKQAWLKAKRPKCCKLKCHTRLAAIVAEKLSLKWSPEQIAGYLKRNYPGNGDMHISHESIYKTLFIQSRGVLKKVLQKHLRTKRVMRQSKAYNTKGNSRGGIIKAISIHDRPQDIEKRTVPGHWEGDLICGTNQSYIATLVERTSRFTLLVKLAHNDTTSVVNAIRDKIIPLPTVLKQSLTWDRGMELAKHKQFTIDTNIKVYFCDPSSPWQRGTNENTNRLLRQYMPKKMDLSVLSQADLDDIAV